jgi:hypothetical protein
LTYKKPIAKLTSGIALFSSFFILQNAIGGADGFVSMRRNIQAVLSFPPGVVTLIAAELFVIAFGSLVVYCFVSGLYRICTFNLCIQPFEEKRKGGIVVSGNSNYPNINRILRYRESKLSSLDNDAALELMKDTAILDALYTGYSNGTEAQRVLSYTESKLAGMSSDRALNYLSHKL